MQVNEVFLDQLIANERRAIRDTIFFAGGLILLGILVIVVSSSLPTTILPDTVTELIGIGGSFISSLSVFQFKDLLARRGKVETLCSLRLRLREVNETHEPEDESANKRIEELVWKIVEKAALG